MICALPRISQATGQPPNQTITIASPVDRVTSGNPVFWAITAASLRPNKRLKSWRPLKAVLLAGNWGCTRKGCRPVLGAAGIIEVCSDPAEKMRSDTSARGRVRTGDTRRKRHIMVSHRSQALKGKESCETTHHDDGLIGSSPSLQSQGPKRARTFFPPRCHHPPIHPTITFCEVCFVSSLALPVHHPACRQQVAANLQPACCFARLASNTMARQKDEVQQGSGA
ncbi:hypothetical protein B0T21DRAFT_422709 [Apiosordaria backusii]|uniref:Uncharacterized protein n=1 Tax=Apiosordaria backusii TaxID=314023 RepID=A0AA40AXD7_9PEZI|nr:hypothetical protein B0T21DRAFT_422709 [Apiosordaria backusii]